MVHEIMYVRKRKMVLRRYQREGLLSYTDKIKHKDSVYKVEVCGCDQKSR